MAALKAAMDLEEAQKAWSEAPRQQRNNNASQQSYTGEKNTVTGHVVSSFVFVWYLKI